MKQILRIKQLTKQFVLHEQGKIIPAAKPVDLTLETGTLTALVGNSGVGKSSLLKCIYRTYLPSNGNINYLDVQNNWIDLATASEYEILKLRRSQMSFVTQFLDFLPRQNTLDVVAKPLFDLGVDRKEARNKSQAILEELNIPERLWKVSPATFSGGEKQRVNIARSLIMRSRLLLLDEPTASLDPETSKKVISLIKRAKEEGTAILAVFHEPQIISELADSTVTLESNRVSVK
ncbi:MAG: phosphonate C-P lyase system protein PhnL [Mastigocoleus sp. MO_167.B18]|uniref:phosphonate C-P lyase system protein PhnL n=1 Tax=Mastigocoleus sp. MO_188.B34 TaxID=3036635 RepID=UPI0026071365|nr:phosphonate C-P lyase system protein PhnL [Mastigocoleus sp. MO_188.B34]MDJ0695410.1 phosphonate C-P lyase system protein PhnL [Mastigocoleus sp. MO_188.B34]MDJ0775224.1 phosphonate C-P lyase system protein PhnL [Mastigocoleus sp. MO_167.B18]